MCNKTIIGRTSQAKSSYSRLEKKEKNTHTIYKHRLRNWVKSTHSILWAPQSALRHSRSTKFLSVQHDKLRPTSIFARRPSCLKLTARTFATNSINRTFQALSKNVFIWADSALSALETFHVKWAI